MFAERFQNIGGIHGSTHSPFVGLDWHRLIAKELNRWLLTLQVTQEDTDFS